MTVNKDNIKLLGSLAWSTIKSVFTLDMGGVVEGYYLMKLVLFHPSKRIK